MVLNDRENTVDIGESSDAKTYHKGLVNLLVTLVGNSGWDFGDDF